MESSRRGVLKSSSDEIIFVEAAAEGGETHGGYELGFGH